jgi:hypothetical protein
MQMSVVLHGCPAEQLCIGKALGPLVWSRVELLSKEVRVVFRDFFADVVALLLVWVGTGFEDLGA